MLKVEIDEQEVKEILLEEIAKKIKQIDAELTLWDSNELKRRTCMSWNTIQQYFFYDERFPKFKIGGKWYFPAKETEEFLLSWIKEQSKS